MTERTRGSSEVAVAMLTAALDDEYQLVGPLAGGETGATEVRRGDGRRYVLKWELDVGRQRSRREGARLAERLRVRARWPAPRQQVIDVDDHLLVVQELTTPDWDWPPLATGRAGPTT